VTLLLVFALTLLLAVVLSALAERSVLSTSVLFLAVGFGAARAGVPGFSGDAHMLSTFAELALFSILINDGLRVRTDELRQTWHLPGRALILGLPVTLAVTAVLAHAIAGLAWWPSLLVGAALSPTDPVFASALIGAEHVPVRLRRLLNVESGLNDGLALPIVLGLLSMHGAARATPAQAVAEVAGGVVLGVVVAWLAVRLVRLPFIAVTHQYAPLGVVAVALIVFSLSKLTHMNEFVSAFVAAVTLAHLVPRARETFAPVGEPVSETLKLAALLIFGALLPPELLRGPAANYVFAFLVILLARPVAIGLALFGSELPRQEWLTAAWFGPKGFASIFFGLLILRSGAEQADRIFDLLALAVTVSVLAHSSTDVLFARWFRQATAA